MEDGNEARMHRALVYELRIPLTAVTDRVQLLRRHLQLGRDSAHLEADLVEIELALIRLAAAVDRLDGRS